MDEVITFNKSFQERLQEYSDVFSDKGSVHVSQIKRKWSFYLQLALDPNGWQALWKIPRSTCESLRITFPTVVLVYVQNIDFQYLIGTVNVLAVQDDIHLPETHLVPLIQLWPTKEQDKTVCLYIHRTANCIDMLRFFYLNLFMPWDNDEDECVDWVGDHLESRLKLFFDTKTGVIPKPTVERLGNLLADARRLQSRREEIEAELNEDSDECNGDIENNTKLSEILDIHIKLKQLKTQVEILEDPLMRNVILNNQKSSPAKSTLQSKRFLIFNEGTIDECITFLMQAKQMVPNEVVTLHPMLASAVEEASKNDTILLSKGTHQLGKSLGDLHNGGDIWGIYGKADTTIAGSSLEIMLDFRGTNTVENLTVEASQAQCGILIRCGTTTIKNCSIRGNDSSSTDQGIIVLAGSSLRLIDCEISNFSMGIVGNSRSTITLTNCKIFNVSIGLKLFDECTLSADNVDISNCREYGVYLETENNSEDGYQKIGKFNILNEVLKQQSIGISGEKNVKGDVIVNKKRKLFPIHDLFPKESVKTVQHVAPFEDEMETSSDEELNVTVVKLNDADV